MSLFLSGVLWVFGAMAVVALFVTLVNRVLPNLRSADNNDAIGLVFTIVGGLNAVVAAFVLIALFDTAGTAEDTAQQEANALTEVHWAGTSLAEPAAGRIQELVRAYATEVAEQEWPDMRAEVSVGAGGGELLNQLRAEVDTAPTADGWQESRKVRAADSLAVVHQMREDRLGSAQVGISSVVWFALVIGSVLTLALTLLYGGAGGRAHTAIITILGGAMTLLVFAIFQLQNPYGGGVDIGPDAFTEVVAVTSTSAP